ncbi:PREDICTED: leucine-rich repeat-containing protein 20 isoform X1 [Bactrocera latifrons]|uniref:Leucine-rich repeat-containing protein 20 n=2 Tax=Bactrocera latifrons TaxID=174628 RepID=A0A0K8W017_BACLA|nr:PREDICTED: leucine-rich repeat-containing protein 20 isoform X1 [Bactrocera latifrons]
MRPFGNDITNIANNSGNSNGGGGGNNNNNNNTNRVTTSNDNNSDNVQITDDPRVPPHIARMGGIVTCSPIAGRGIIRVVGRCEDAKENNILDLSECQLMQIPDAVYHLMRNTQLKTCDLSSNVIKKIPAKFALKFNLITDLNLSHNQMTKLPDELADLNALARLNISHNSFIVLPPVVFKMPELRELDASHNAIIEIDTDEMITSDNLELVNLRHNPLGRTCHRKLKNVSTSFRLEISEYNEDDDW